MTSAFEQLHENIRDRANANLNSILSNEDQKGRHVIAHNDIFDVETLIASDFVSQPLKELGEIVILELHNSLFMALIGAYKHAFTSLRSALELYCVAIQFSVDEIAFRQWKAGGEDITWGKLMDVDKGIYSHQFIKAFAPALFDKSKEFFATAKSVYRECSEYIHCNPQSIQAPLLRYDLDDELVTKLVDRVSVVKTLMVFHFVIRYRDELPVQELEDIILGEFSQIEEVRKIYE